MSQEQPFPSPGGREVPLKPKLRLACSPLLQWAHGRAFAALLRNVSGTVLCLGEGGGEPYPRVGTYRAALLVAGPYPGHRHFRLVPVRRLTREMADDGLLDPAVAAAIARVAKVAGTVPDSATGSR